MTKNRHSRRAFMKTAGIAGVAGVGSVSLPRLTLAAAPNEADLVVHNAKIYTLDGAQTAQGFAVRGGRFSAVGSNDTAKAYIGKDTQVIDAKGMTITPGFIDCHCHPVGTQLLYELLVGNPFEVEFVTIDGVIAKMKALADKTPPGHWVDGYFFDDTKVKDKGRPLTASELDKVSTQHPVVVNHRGGHTYFFNHKAFEMAGITKDTPNPPGGTYDKLPNGELSGRVTDRARYALDKVGVRPTFNDAEKQERERRGIAHMSQQFARYGLTTVHHQGGDLLALQQIRDAGELKHRVSYEMEQKMLDALIDNGFRTGFGDDWIKIGATFEHTVDGSFSERTMSMSVPFPGRTPPYYGNITETQDVLNAWAEKTHRAGIQMNCHANGDVAIASVLTAYERAFQLYPTKDPRPKITHCTMINPDILKRMAAIGAVPAVFTSYAYYNSDKFGFYGEELMKNFMAFRSFLDAGIKVCAGSDFYPGPFSPLMGMQGMVTRTGWDGKTWGANQRVTVPEALRILSSNGAWANHEESVKGSITEGKFADFVIMADDPHTVDPGAIKDIKIVRTVTGGKTMYEA